MCPGETKACIVQSTTGRPKPLDCDHNGYPLESRLPIGILPRSSAKSASQTSTGAGAAPALCLDGGLQWRRIALDARLSVA